MSYEYSKTKQVRLREVGKDEKWLQDLIAREPSILEPGMLNFSERRAHSQPAAGST